MQFIQLLDTSFIRPAASTTTSAATATTSVQTGICTTTATQATQTTDTTLSTYAILQQNQALANENARLRGLVKKLEDDNKEKTGIVFTAFQYYKNQESEIKDLHRQVEHLTDDLDSAHLDIVNFEDDLHRLGQAAQVDADNIDGSYTEIKALKYEKGCIGLTIGVKDKEIEALNATIAELKVVEKYSMKLEMNALETQEIHDKKMREQWVEVDRMNAEVEELQEFKEDIQHMFSSLSEQTIDGMQAEYQANLEIKDGVDGRRSCSPWWA